MTAIYYKILTKKATRKKSVQLHTENHFTLLLQETVFFHKETLKIY